LDLDEVVPIFAQRTTPAPHHHYWRVMSFHLTQISFTFEYLTIYLNPSPSKLYNKNLLEKVDLFAYKSNIITKIETRWFQIGTLASVVGSLARKKLMLALGEELKTKAQLAATAG
jgi:hypothetical protein